MSYSFVYSQYEVPIGLFTIPGVFAEEWVVTTTFAQGLPVKLIVDCTDHPLGLETELIY